MAVILFLEQSIVTEVVVEDPPVMVWIMEVQEGRVAVLHVGRTLVRPSKLQAGLEILEEILQEVYPAEQLVVVVAAAQGE